jgi:UDP-N-acetylglucosamine 2-epimerase
MKVVTLVGTRPEIIRLSETIKLLDKHMNHTFIHSGQNMGNNMKNVFFEDLELRKPDIEWEADHSSLSRIIASTMEKLEAFIKENKPDVIVTLGDTNSALAVLIAKRLGVITYHLEAGNRSFDENVPEEINRRIIDHFSDFNLVYSDHAYNNLMREGLSPRRTVKCGSPLKEVVNVHLSKISASRILDELKLTEKGYFLVSLHRQENVDLQYRLVQAIESINSIATNFDLPVVISMHPRTREKINRIGIKFSDKIIEHEPFGFIDYMKLQKDAFCVLSDSGTISEESSILGFPAITLRDSMERPEALDVGAMIMTGLEYNQIKNAILLVTSDTNIYTLPASYDLLNHSQSVVKYIQSTAGRAHEWLGIRR